MPHRNPRPGAASCARGRQRAARDGSKARQDHRRLQRRLGGCTADGATRDLVTAWRRVPSRGPRPSGVHSLPCGEWSLRVPPSYSLPPSMPTAANQLTSAPCTMTVNTHCARPFANTGALAAGGRLPQEDDTGALLHVDALCWREPTSSARDFLVVQRLVLIKQSFRRRRRGGWHGD